MFRTDLRTDLRYFTLQILIILRRGLNSTLMACIGGESSNNRVIRVVVYRLLCVIIGRERKSTRSGETPTFRLFRHCLLIIFRVFIMFFSTSVNSNGLHEFTRRNVFSFRGVHRFYLGTTQTIRDSFVRRPITFYHRRNTSIIKAQCLRRLRHCSQAVLSFPCHLRALRFTITVRSSKRYLSCVRTRRTTAQADRSNGTYRHSLKVMVVRVFCACCQICNCPYSCRKIRLYVIIR